MKNVVSTSDVRSARIWPLASAATFGGKNLAVGKKGRVRDGSTSAKQSQIAARIQGSVLHRATGSLPLLSIAPQLQQSRGESTLFNTPRGDDERSCSKALSPVSVSVVRGRRFESTSGRIRYRRALGGGPFPR